MTSPDTSPKVVATVLRLELEDLQAAQLDYLRDTQERQMVPDADKVRRMNDRALLLSALADALDAQAVTPPYAYSADGPVYLAPLPATPSDDVSQTREPNWEQKVGDGCWPVAILQDRYLGSYLGGEWLAVSEHDRNGHLDDVQDIYGNDSTAMAFKIPEFAAVGNTPDEALANLYRKIGLAKFPEYAPVDTPTETTHG